MNETAVANRWEDAMDSFRRGILQTHGLSDAEADRFAIYSWLLIPERAKDAWRKYCRHSRAA